MLKTSTAKNPNKLFYLKMIAQFNQYYQQSGVEM